MLGTGLPLARFALAGRRSVVDAAYYSHDPSWQAHIPVAPAGGDERDRRLDTAVKLSRICRVSGRVQGVFYRAETCARARALGVSGWVKNLPDGRVEVSAEGDAPAVEALCAWLWRGPPSARVVDVACRPAAEAGLDGFHIR